MRVTALGIIVMTGLLVGACSDVSAPLNMTPSFAKKKGGGKTSWDSYFGSGISFQSDTITEGASLPSEIEGNDAPENTLEHASGAPTLETYRTSFTHVAGETTIFALSYRNTSGFKHPFLLLQIPPDAEVVGDNGKPVKKGRSVEITVEVDLTKFLVHFGPHGSTFLRSRPAVLWFYYGNAEQSGQNPETLTMWYQPTAGEAWTMLGTEIDTFFGWARAEIDHFSNYAIAW